jgi:hypothetical protein
MKSYGYILICLAFMACNAKSKGNAPADSAKSTVKSVPYTGPFDLAKLTLKENILNIMNEKGVKREAKDTLDKTLFGYEIFKTTDPKVLRFENTDLSGANGKNKNYVLLHYNERTKTLAFYELVLYNQNQTDALITLLGKVGKIVFKQTKTSKGAIEIDENGNEVKPGTGERKTFRVWENKSTGLSYFLSEIGSGKNLTSTLTVLKRSEQSGKYWISFLALDWYKDSKSEPL